MDGQINASWKTIFELTKHINESVKRINSLNTDLLSNLDKLGSTFKDDEYVAIKSLIIGNQQKVKNAVPDLVLVMNTLIEYADLLKKSDEAARGN